MLLALGLHRPAVAQDVSVSLGVRRTIQSAVLNEARMVVIHLRASYDTSARSYPVLYLLDGANPFLLQMVAVTERLQMVEVSDSSKDQLRDVLAYRYETFAEYPQIPFPCLCDGLRFVTAEQPK